MSPAGPRVYAHHMIRTYEGRCHCGAVRFRFESEEITRGIRCNCSMCIRKGAVMSTSYVPAQIEGREALTLYRFGDVTVNQYFCKHCGIYPFHEIIREPGRYRFNLGCVEGVDPLALEIKLIDGRSY